MLTAGVEVVLLIIDSQSRGSVSWLVELFMSQVGCDYQVTQLNEPTLGIGEVSTATLSIDSPLETELPPHSWQNRKRVPNVII